MQALAGRAQALRCCKVEVGKGYLRSARHRFDRSLRVCHYGDRRDGTQRDQGGLNHRDSKAGTAEEVCFGVHVTISKWLFIFKPLVLAAGSSERHSTAGRRCRWGGGKVLRTL